MPWNDPNALLGIGGIVVGIVSIIISVFLYFRSKNKKILEYKMDSTPLITEKMTSIPNLKIIIDDQPVETLSSTTIEFFNAGNQSIVLSDFAIKEPLGITIAGHVHSYDVSATNPNSTPDLQSIDDKIFHIKFDFLKQKQSFSITLLHEGTVNIFGELTNGTQREYRKLRERRKYWYGQVSAISVFAIIINLIPDFWTNATYSLKDVFPVVAMVLLLIPLFSELLLFLSRKAEYRRKK